MPVNPVEFGFESEHVDLPGLRLHLAAAGPPDGPLVILLHGFPELWYSWRAQLAVLARAGFRALAPDQRGYHLSGKAPPYDQATLANDIVHLIDRCGRDQAHIVGHDWGGVVAWRLAEWHPRRVRSLSILNVAHPAVGVRAMRRGSLRQALRSSYIYFFQLRGLAEWVLSRRDFAALRAGMQGSASPETFSPADLDRYAAAWAEPGALTAMLGWYRAFMRWAAREFWRTPLLPKLDQPAQLIWGERDFSQGIELAEASARLLAHGRLVRLPGVSHWVQQEAPERVNQLLLAHLRAAG